MTPDDRNVAVQIVRDTRTALAAYVSRVAKDLAAGEPLRAADGERTVDLIDRDTAQALLSLTKAASEVVAMHPGLLELANDSVGDDGAVGGDDAAERVRRALGLPGGPAGTG
jgi:hypothetical protein